MDGGLLLLGRHWKNQKVVAQLLRMKPREEGCMGRLGMGEHALPLLCTLLKEGEKIRRKAGWEGNLQQGR